MRTNFKVFAAIFSTFLTWFPGPLPARAEMLFLPSDPIDEGEVFASLGFSYRRWDFSSGTETTRLHLSAAARYGITDRWGAGLSIPFAYNKTTGGGVEADAGGIGDISVRTFYDVLHERGAGRAWDLDAFAVVYFPTGDDTAPYGLGTGKGEVQATFGMSADRRTRKWMLGGSASYYLDPSSDDAIAPGYGDDINFSAVAGYKLFEREGEGATGLAVFLGLDFDLLERVGTGNDGFQGDRIFSLNPGVSYYVGSWVAGVGASIPVHDRLLSGFETADVNLGFTLGVRL